MKKVIRVYDDMKGRGRIYAERLRALKVVGKNYEVESITHKDFRQEVRLLRARQESARRGEWDNENSLFDETSVLVIDYDLLRLFRESYLTGDMVAYLARCFSRCGLILGLNIDLQKAGENPFDLTLRGHPESYCDLNIGSKQLDNAGLWGGKTKGFRPWHWPQFPDYLESFKEKSRDVVRHLDDPLCDILGIKDVMKISSKSITGFIGGDPEKSTFRGFVEKSGNGLKGRDKISTEEIAGRIAAARISKWLERVVLSGQDLLVDAPHLVFRYPSLLKGKRTDINAWDRTARFDAFDKLGLDHKLVEEFRFKRSHWLSRPVWFWRDLSKSTRIKEVEEPWEREIPDFVFCEDSSSFCEREKCRRFSIETDSPYNRRFIRYFRKEGVNYQPRVRLL